VLALCLAFEPALAQVPNAGQILQEVTPEPNVPPKPNQQLLPPITPSKAGKVPSGPSITLTLRSVRFKGNTVYTAPKLQPLVQQYVGKKIGMPELQAMANAVTDYYQRGGYFLAHAFYEPQDVSTGDLQISILEGKVGRVRVEKAPDAPVPDSRINGLLSAIKPGDALNQYKLERAMLLVSDLPGINAQSSLEAGVEPGTTDLVVQITKGRRLRVSFDADNYGTYYTGYYRFGGSLRWLSPLNLGDAVDLRLLGSNDSGVLFGRLGYEVPVGSSGLRFNAGMGRLEYQLQQNLAALGGKGYADTADLGLTYPLIRSRAQNLYAQVGLIGKRLQDRFDAVGFESDKHVLMGTAGLNYELRDRLLGGGYTSLSGTFYAGNLTLSTEADRLADQSALGRHTEGRFNKFGFAVSRLQSIWGPFTAFIGLTGQLANKNLDSAEQIALGGATAVRAYPASEGIVAEGAVATAEFRYSFLNDLTASVFYDAGWGRINVDPVPGLGENNVRLRGYGLGLTWIRPGSFSVRTSVAWRDTGPPTSDPHDRKPLVFAQAVKTF
jgi:hemolysin activation/secretion protein